MSSLPDGAQIQVVHLSPEKIEELRREKGNVVYESGRKRADFLFSREESTQWNDWILKNSAEIWATAAGDDDDAAKPLDWKAVRDTLFERNPDARPYIDTHPKLMETLCSENPSKDLLTDMIFFDLVQERMENGTLDRQAADMLVGKYLVQKYRREHTEEEKKFIEECHNPTVPAPETGGYQTVRKKSDILKLPANLRKKMGET